MPEIPYKLQKTISGKLRVKYECPACKSPLESELAEAGSKDTCPDCQKPFLVPGVKKRLQVEKELAEKLARQKAEHEQREARKAEQERIASEQAAVAKQQQEAERALHERQQREAEARQAEVELNRRRRFTQQSGNTDYPALAYYIEALRVSGWACIAFGILAGLGVFGLTVLNLAAAAREGVDAESSLLFGFVGTLVMVVLGLILGLPMFVTSQLIRMFLDLRRDIAKLVDQEQFRNG